MFRGKVQGEKKSSNDSEQKMSGWSIGWCRMITIEIFLPIVLVILETQVEFYEVEVGVEISE